MADDLTHLDDKGRAHMVDVSDKDRTVRTATASGAIRMHPDTLARIVDGQVEKGDVLAVARIGGITAAKRASDLIPLCHPVALTSVSVEFTADDSASALLVTATARAADRTGVEMEALAAVAGACLTVYDMCKAVDRAMEITDVRLDLKSGGRSGTWTR
jgi:cyclic pyranopterin phosphate synthase